MKGSDWKVRVVHVFISSTLATFKKEVEEGSTGWLQKAKKKKKLGKNKWVFTAKALNMRAWKRMAQQ